MNLRNSLCIYCKCLLIMFTLLFKKIFLLSKQADFLFCCFSKLQLPFTVKFCDIFLESLFFSFTVAAVLLASAFYDSTSIIYLNLKCKGLSIIVFLNSKNTYKYLNLTTFNNLYMYCCNLCCAGKIFK